MVMNQKRVFVTFGIIAMLVLAAVAIEAAGSYRLPSTHKGLVNGVSKADLFTPKEQPCQKYGCTAWDTVVGDKKTSRAYDCRCNVPTDLKKENTVCFKSASNAKKAKPGYRVDTCKK